jgi:hypothetical protein
MPSKARPEWSTPASRSRSSGSIGGEDYFSDRYATPGQSRSSRTAGVQTRGFWGDRGLSEPDLVCPHAHPACTHATFAITTLLLGLAIFAVVSALLPVSASVQAGFANWLAGAIGRRAWRSRASAFGPSRRGSGSLQVLPASSTGRQIGSPVTATVAEKGGRGAARIERRLRHTGRLAFDRPPRRRSRARNGGASFR